MADAQLIAALGSRGMGKSAWVKQQIAALNPPRLVVWDLVREFLPEGDAGAITEPGQLIRSMTGRKYHLVFHPSGDKVRRAKQFEWFCRGLMSASTKDQPIVAVVEELAFVTSPSWAPGAWQEISLLGRHRGLTVFGTSQRPASIDKDFLGNCTLVHCARLGYEPDAKVVAKRLGCTAEELLNLEKLHYLERAEMEKKPTAGVLSFDAKPRPLGRRPKARNSTG